MTFLLANHDYVRGRDRDHDDGHGHDRDYDRDHGRGCGHHRGLHANVLLLQTVMLTPIRFLPSSRVYYNIAHYLVIK